MKGSKVKDVREELDLSPERDEHFAFIAGYTPHGFPYGITWKEWDVMDNSPSCNDYA